MIRTRKCIDEHLDPVAAWLERHSKLLAAVLLAFMLLVAIGVASHKLLWYDELITVFTASLPTVGQLLRFFADGLDTTSPVASLAARAGMRLPLPPELAVRFPFILGYLGMCLGLYGFIRRRYTAGYALAALVFPLILPTFIFFMTEARPYALMLGGVGLAMYFWQSAADGKARPWSVLALWLALALAAAAHFFAVFVFVPFAAAQLALDWTRKRADWPVWLALLAFPAGFLPFLPGTQRASKFYRAAFHAKAHLSDIRIPYRDIYATYAWVPVSILLLLAIGWLLLEANGANDPDASRPQPPQSTGLTQAEWVFTAVLNLLPIYVVLVSLKLGVFRPQYVLSFYIGFIVLVVAAFAEVTRRRAAAGALALLVILTSAGMTHAKSALTGVKALTHLSRVHDADIAQATGLHWLQTASAGNLPLAVDPNSYISLEYYGPPELRQRIYTLIDQADFAYPKYSMAVSDQQNFLLFSRMLPVHPTEIDDFLAHHPHFLVRTGFDEHEWLPDYLLRRQAKGDLSVTILSNDDSGTLLDVQIK
jgi:dolichyl-phosphate-mannose-protein mannosyltransferase